MKLIFNMKILLFALTSLWLIFEIKSEDNIKNDLEGQDLISFLMTGEEFSMNNMLKNQTQHPRGKTKGLPNLKPKEIDVPVTYGSLLKGYSFIFGEDDASKEIKEADQFEPFEVALLIYRNVTKEDKVGRIALDLREFAWKCGPKKTCPLENLYNNSTGKEIDVNALKSQVNTFMSKINGISKVCVGDIYTDPQDKKKAIVFCFNSQSDLTKFEQLFNFVNTKDLNDTSTMYDVESEQNFDLQFTDGHDTLIQKKITFKVDGMYENKTLLMKYDTLETFDGKKCNIAQNMPIVPIKFVDVKIFNTKCVGKFRYNKVDTYMGSTDANCVNIFSYVTSKMGSSCMKVKSGPMNKFISELVSRPAEGKWTGWTRYHKIMDNGGTVDPNPFKVVINPENIEIFDNKTASKQKIDFKNITWSCNDDGDCTIKDFILYLTHSKQSSKLNDFRKVVTQLVEKWTLQDYNHCFVIEENDIHIVCPIDYSEEYAVRYALSVAMDKKLVDAEAKTFLPFRNGSVHNIIFATDTNIYFEDHSVTILPEGVKNNTGEMIIDYQLIKPLKNIQCGFEFRLLSLPNQFHEINPYCCARFFTDENNYICTQQQSKCYIPLRRMIQLVKTNCLAAQGNPSNNTNPIPTPIKPEQDKNNTKRAWSGEVIFQEIDNYKYKGELDLKRGYLSLDTNNATYQVNNENVFTYALESLNFICESATPCLPADYLANQQPFLEKGYDRDWQQATLSKFWEQNSKVNQKDCMVLVAEDNFYETSAMILTCATATGQGESMRQSILDVYNQKIAKLKGKEKEMKNIPPAADNREFQALVVSTIKTANPKTVQAASTNVKVALDGVMYKASGEYVFKYTDVINTQNNQVNLKFSLSDDEVPQDIKTKKAEIKCCFKAWSGAGQVFFVCLSNGVKCFHDKAVLFKTVQSRAERALAVLTAQLKRQALALNARVEDPFTYGLNPKYKKYEPTYNLDNLNEDTFDNSRNGEWEGYVYEAALTERNFNKKVNPVWMTIGDGMISFKTEEDITFNYKELKLNEYDQLCMEHCQPREYIQKKLTSGAEVDFDDMMYLKKSVENFLGQIKNAYVEEGCVLMDFVSPLFQFGHTDMICGVDKMQGEKIRMAIDNSYYQALLDIDIDKEVRRPYMETDKFFAKIIVNEKYVEAFNNVYLDQFGIIGKKISHDPKIKEPLSKEVFNVTFAQVAEDNFGTSCAFWYKNLKLKQRNAEMKNVVPDNNCCFKFFTKNDKKKIEICTYHLDGRICIKQARELMKGMKLGCLNYNKFSTDTNTKNEAEKDNSIDIYNAKTIDDSDNGQYDGFVFFGGAMAASQTPKSNPYYIKIHKMSLEIYDDHTKTNNATISIDLGQLQFNCAGNSPCTPEKFHLYAQTNPKYMSSASQIMTVYNMFKETYGIQETFEKSCFVIETSQMPFLICPYIPETAESMKKAIVNAFIQNHSCRRLSSISDTDPTTKYHVIISENGSQREEDVQVTIKGVMTVKTKQVVLNYRKLDKDPVNKNQKCAVWYKEVPIKFEFEHPECCFAVSIDNKVTTVCVKQDKICVGTTFKLMKAIWNGCMYSAPSQNIMKPSPDSETLGEPSWKVKKPFQSNVAKYDICPANRNLTIFDHEKLHNDYIVDMFNDVAYSLNKTLYKGWFNVYPIDMDKDSSWDLQNLYGELSPEGFKFYENDKERKNPKLLVRPDLLSMACGKKEACKPMAFVDYLAKHNSSMSHLKDTLQSKLDLYEVKQENGCAVLENIVANLPNYFIICAHIRKTRSNIQSLQDVIDKPTPYSKARNLLSSHYGKIIRQIVYDAYIVSRKYIGTDAVPDGDEPIKQAHMTLIMNRNEHFNVSITDAGVVSNGNNMIVKFDDLQHCRVRYNLVYAPVEVVYDEKPQCCFRYMGPANNEYVCIRELNCEYSTYKMSKKFQENCKQRKNRQIDTLINEHTTGDNVYAMTVIKQVFKSEMMFSDIKALNPTEEISTDEFKVKHKTLAIKYLFKIKELIHSINLVDIIKSKKLTTTPHDTTPIDPPSPTVSGVAPKYIGENKKFTVTAAKNFVTQFKDIKNGDIVTIIRNLQFIKTKDFSAIIGKNSEYVLITYDDDGNKIIEITKSRVFITDSSANLAVEQYTTAGGVTIPSAPAAKH